MATKLQDSLVRKIQENRELKDTIKDLHAQAEKAFEQGFYAGFKASGEGWNGECPFNDLGLDIQQNESVQHELKEAMENYQKGETD